MAGSSNRQEAEEELLLRAARLLDMAKRLGDDERRVLSYFMKNVSVGDIRAVLDLERLGVKNAETIIERLIDLGFLEKGTDCYNLSKPLRVYVFRKQR
ncbi:MAG: hypothetical protein LRS48_02240 [Desulfurococcales archaeon]|nr:hypothetical protein [Desulfurococcales archaeon]